MGLFSCSVPLWLPLKPGTAVDTDTVDTAVDMEVMVDTVLDTAMVDTVARDPQKLMLKPITVTATLDTDTVPDTVLELTDTVPDTVPDTDSAMLDTVPDTVSDTAMVDTVERDPLMPGTDADTVDTALDTDTAVDTDTKHLSNQLTKETILYKI